MFEGFVSPFAEAEQRAQYTNQAWDAVRSDPASAALIAGLSLLAGNNGERTVGQLVGRAGLDTLEGMRRLDAQKRAQVRFAERNVSADSAASGTKNAQAEGSVSGAVPVPFFEGQSVAFSAASPSAGEAAALLEPQARPMPAGSARRRRLVRPRTGVGR